MKFNIKKIRLLYVIDLKHERRFNLNWIYVISSFLPQDPLLHQAGAGRQTLHPRGQQDGSREEQGGQDSRWEDDYVRQGIERFKI